MAEGLGSSKELGNKEKQFSEAQAEVKALSLSDSQHHLEEIFRQSNNSTSKMTMHEDGVSNRGKGKSRVCVVPRESCSMPFKQHQLKQLRAQCIVYLAFSNGVAPKEQYLEIALGATFSGESDS